MNTSLLYAIENKRILMGVELNTNFYDNDMGAIIHPQVRFTLNKNTAIGAAIGIPLISTNEKFNVFARLIYEID